MAEVENPVDPTIEQVPRDLPFEEAPAEELAADSIPADMTSDDQLPGSDQPVSAAGSSWYHKLPPAIKKHAETIANHPYVTQGSENLRQRAGALQGRVQPYTQAAQDRLQPIVNHPVVKRGTDTLRATGAQTLETGKKVYNREEGYEPKRFVPFFAATIGLLLLGVLFRVLGKRYGSKEEL